MTAASSTRPLGPFSAMAVLWMVVVGCVSALLFLVLNAYAPQLRHESSGGVDALSKSAVGFAGLAELLGQENVPVVLSRDAHPGPRTRASLLILTPDIDTDPKAMARLGGADAELIVLPKWAVAPDPQHPGWVSKFGLLPADAISRQLLNAYDGGDHIEREALKTAPTLSGGLVSGARNDLPLSDAESLQTIAGPDKGWVSIVETRPGHALLIRARDRGLFILSDPDLLNNHGLARLANARAASDIIAALRGGGQDPGIARQPVFIDLTLAGFTRSRSLLALAFEPPFLAATLCAIAAAGLMGLHAAARFGPHLRGAPAFALGKRALADNSAALIRLVRREHRMGGGYAALTRTLTARAVGAPRDLDDDQMDALLDRLGRAKGVAAAFTDLERRARDAPDAAALMTAAHALYAWRLEMTHDRR